MTIIAGRYRRGLDSTGGLAARVETLELLTDDSKHKVWEFFGEYTEITVEHNKGRQVSATFVNRDGDHCPIDIQQIDNNTILVSSVMLLDGFLLIL